MEDVAEKVFNIEGHLLDNLNPFFSAFYQN
jgi:hypothetical protein